MKWEKKSLTDFVWFQRGFDLPKDKFVNGEFPVVGSTSILGYHIEAKVKAPGLVTGRSGTIGQFQFLNIDFWPHNTSLWVKDFYGNDEKFAYYLMHTLDFISLNGGGAVPSLNRNFLSSINVNIPPLPTQRRIASILSSYDDLIENNLKRIKLLEEKAFASYKLIVKSEKLEEFSIEEVCETSGGGTPATGDRRFWDDGEILWFSPTDLTKHNSIVLLDSDKKITELGLQKSSAKLVPPKTILMTSRASIGYFGIINKPVSTNQGFINIIPFNNNHRAFMLFNLKNRKEEIIGNANGSTFLEISKSKFRQMKIKIPKDEKILIEFEKEFETLFNFIENLLNQNTKLREARDILLPRLMSGQMKSEL